MKSKKFIPGMIGILFIAFIFSACAPASATARDELGDKVWVLNSMAGHPALPGTSVTLEFNFDESIIGGNATCNSYFGGFEVKGEEMTITETGATLMACAEQDRMQQESDFLQALSTVRSYEVVNGELHLVTSNGQILIFTAE